MDSQEFSDTLWQYYAQHGRHDLPWRQPLADGSYDPYLIFVSELMLQQTQVQRVTPKFHDFSRRFPTVQELAAAPLADVLKAWSGLGYNRRAKFLWQAAQMVVDQLGGTFPRTLDGLVALPGIGKHTAGAILAYAYDQPAPFIETNVRTVYIHHFFKDRTDVSDKELLPLLEQTIDREHPREFYWAVMDYGSHLKRTVGNLSKFSSSYAKQSRFEGSKRQLRGQVLRLLAIGSQTQSQLADSFNDERLPLVLRELVSEQLIQLSNGKYRL